MRLVDTSAKEKTSSVLFFSGGGGFSGVSETCLSEVNRRFCLFVFTVIWFEQISNLPLCGGDFVATSRQLAEAYFL